MLVATDVAARGLDVNDMTHIINYKFPDELELYIHRSGRTGRAGKSGISISIVHTRELNKIKSLEKLTNKKFTKAKIPSGKEICEKQLFNLVDRMEKIEVDETKIESYMEVIYKKLEWLSREDLIKRFVSVEFNRFLNYYKNAPDLNVSESKHGREDREPREVSKSRSFTRFFINVGSNNKLTPPRMIGLINDYSKRRNIEIGKIDILKNFTFFELDKKFEKDILMGFKNSTFQGIKLSVEISKPERKKSKGEYSGGRDSRKRKKRY